MAVIINECYVQKARSLKRPLKEAEAFPKRRVRIVEDKDGFQGLSVIDEGETAFPLELLAGEEIILDFGDHFVGYLSLDLDNDGALKITDSPVRLHFSFGEFPLEAVTPPESFRGSLSNGWLQQEERSWVFTPCSAVLDRRYSFRYLKIRRTDSARFPVKITALRVKSVSAVDMKDAPAPASGDELLDKIYNMSVKTLKECEQDVFEDGPKRDRRLWIGDLKLQAMTDYGIFRNLELIKRCIYLFASATGEHKMVAPCIFPDSPPYVDEWTFCDYSLFFISCLYDWYNNTDDNALVGELYPVAKQQMKAVSESFDRSSGEIKLNPFIDWCPGLDKSAAVLGVYLYTLRQLVFLEELLGEDSTDTENEIKAAEKCLLALYDKENHRFLGRTGQISEHSQVWGVLSGVLSPDDALSVIKNARLHKTEYTMRTPYMMHYYISALYSCGQREEALGFIRSYWGRIAEAGFDCCPEIFNPENELESPYNAPEINSACHAWSCTPAYWIPKLIK